MNRLHEEHRDTKIPTKPEGGLQVSLCSNKVSLCSSPLGFVIPPIISPVVSENDALDYLAEVLVHAFLDHKKHHANTNTTKSSALLPSINERAG